MSVTFSTVVIPDGNHASLAIPDSVLAELNANRRAPVRITVNGHTYQSTTTAVAGECRVVFPSADRKASGVSGGVTEAKANDTRQRRILAVLDKLRLDSNT